MKSSQNKPSLEDLFVSKKLTSPRPESWSDFEKKVKIKTLDSFHRQSSTRYAKYILPLVILSIVPIFIYDRDFVFSASSSTEVVTSNANFTTKSTNAETNDLSAVLSNSDIEFTYNSYSPSHSDDYEMSFALENMKTSGEITSYTTPTFLLDESNLKEYSSNFSF